MHTGIKTKVNMFAILNHTALKLDIKALRNYFKVTCEYELHTSPNTIVSAAEDHVENYTKFKPPLVRPTVDLYGTSFICNKSHAFTTSSAVFTRICFTTKSTKKFTKMMSMQSYDVIFYFRLPYP